MATLKRYKRHYRLKTRQNVTKTELALAVNKHFASQHVDEVRLPCRRSSPAGLRAPRALDARAQAETIQLFVYSARSSTLQYGACRALGPRGGGVQPPHARAPSADARSRPAPPSPSAAARVPDEALCAVATHPSRPDAARCVLARRSPRLPERPMTGSGGACFGWGVHGWRL